MSLPDDIMAYMDSGDYEQQVNTASNVAYTDSGDYEQMLHVASNAAYEVHYNRERGLNT